jgi:small subunit ribosomal protein S17
MEQTSTVKTMRGVVVSNKMDKTAAVVVERRVKHPLYGKIIRRRTKLLCHDETNQCSEGDTVDIVETRPYSKRKAWKVISVVEKAK